MAEQTNIYEIGRAVKNLLVAKEVVTDAAKIVWAARSAMPHIRGKLDIVLRPRREQSIQGIEKGGQRHGMILIRVIDIIIRTSYAANEAADDETWYEQHVPVEDAVLSALAGNMLANASGFDLLTCPIKYLGASEEAKETGVAAKNLWGDSVHSFEMHFKPKLNLALMP